MRFISEGNDAKVVMSGIGGSAKQAWPKVSSVQETFTFLSTTDLERLPYHQFDARTDPLSQYNSSVVFGGKLTPQGNPKPTYEVRLLDRAFDGASLAIETVIPNAAKTLTLPSMLVLSAKKDDSNTLVGVEYGGNGFRVLSLVGTTTVYEYVMAYPLTGGSTIKVERFLNWVQIYVNGIRITAVTHPSFSLVGYPGVGLFSSESPNTSTPIGPTKIYGGSSLARTYGAQTFFEKQILLPRGETTTIAQIYVQGGRSMRAITRSFRWGNMGSWNRNIKLILNGTNLGAIGGYNGVDYIVSNPFTVPEHSIVRVDAWNNELLDIARIVVSGSIELVPA